LTIVNDINVIHSDLYRHRLFLQKKPIDKRCFRGLFLNADALATSIRGFVSICEKASDGFPTLEAVALRAYYDEYSALAERKVSTNQKKNLLNILNANPHYRALLKKAPGRFFRLLRICMALGLKKLQVRLIVQRYR